MDLEDKFDELLENSIILDEYFVEATFQLKLMMELTDFIDKSRVLSERKIQAYELDSKKHTKVFPERNIQVYGLNSKEYVKKEIDIVIEAEKDDKIAIELKMPMKRNGQVPEQMYSIVKDIKFLEQLKESGEFNKCYLLTVTNNDSFWERVPGREKKEIYKYFRYDEILTGKIEKPTGENKGFHQISGKYKITWKNLGNGFRYFTIKI